MRCLLIIQTISLNVRTINYSNSISGVMEKLTTYMAQTNITVVSL